MPVKNHPRHLNPLSLLSLPALLLSLLVLATASPCPAQCRGWVNGPLDFPDGVDGNSVLAAVSWDHDNNPATRSLLVVAGRFTSAGGAPALNIASWDGRVWRALGSGLNATIGTARVAALTVHDGDLIAGGTFNRAGITTVNNVARWNGFTWSAMGNPQSVYALASLNGELYAGGEAGVRRSSTPTWVLEAPTIGGPVLTLAVHQNAYLYAGGGFTQIDGVPANRVARSLNGGTWTGLGAGVTGGTFPVVNVIAPYSSSVVLIAGRFTHAGGQLRANAAVWNEGSWSPGINFDLGIGGVDTVFGASKTSANAPYLVATYRHLNATRDTVVGFRGFWEELGELDDFGRVVHLHDPLPSSTGDERIVVGGDFLNRNGVPTSRIAEAQIQNLTASWSALTNTATIYAFAQVGGVTYAGGTFAYGTETGVANNLARWTGTSVMPVAEFPFPDIQGTNGTVRALRAVTSGFDTDLYIGGDFTQSGGGPANRIIRYQIRVGGARTYFTMGDGFNGSVRAIEQHNGSIYAGGSFTQSGGTTVHRVARWDGTAWQPLGPIGNPGVNGTVNALRSFGGQLYAGGEFTMAGSTTTQFIARWDGSAWYRVATLGMNGWVGALAVDGGTLVAGGGFSTAGGVPAYGVARWNGSAWSQAGNGLIGVVYALTARDGRVYAGGSFSLDFTSPNHTVAVLDGPEWSTPWNAEPDNTVLALAFRGTEMQAGGTFTRLAPVNTLAPGWAELRDFAAPPVVSQPTTPVSACPGETVAFSFVLDPDYAPAYSYQWRREGVVLANGPTPHGSVVAGATSPMLVITGARPTDTGIYTATATRSLCGVPTVSTAATLTVGGPACCVGDADGDGDTDSDDVVVFFAAWDAGEAGGDTDGDGDTDSDDIIVFFNSWDSGC